MSDDKKPIADAYAVVPGPARKDIWVPVGAAWETEKGIMIRMDAEPLAWKGPESRSLFLQFREGKDPRGPGGRQSGGRGGGQGQGGGQGYGGQGGGQHGTGADGGGYGGGGYGGDDHGGGRR